MWVKKRKRCSSHERQEGYKKAERKRERVDGPLYTKRRSSTSERDGVQYLTSTAGRKKEDT